MFLIVSQSAMLMLAQEANRHSPVSFSTFGLLLYQLAP